MNIQTIQASKKKQAKTETLVLPVFESLKFQKAGLTDAQYEKINETIKEKEFLGKQGEVFTLPRYGSTGRIILLGLGDEKKFTLDTWKRTLGNAVRFLQERKVLEFSVFLPEDIEKSLGGGQALRLSTIILHTASYEFNEYYSDKKRGVSELKKVTFIVSGSRKIAEDKKEVAEAQAIGGAMKTTRRLGNMPPVTMTPKYFAGSARSIGKKYAKLHVRALGRAELKREKMGGLLGVGAGSSAEPQFIIMEWMNAPKTKGTRVFAGKGITFDSGGISIKPAAKMDEMKFDMMGGAAVLGAMEAIAKLGLEVNVVGLISASENLSGDAAYRPGDILRAKNGKTIEVLNTDAEGRIVLSDALSYASKYKPKFVLDLATLTGACVVALGGNYAGLFTRDEKIRSEVEAASKKAGEKVWSLPMDDDLSEQMKSPIADVRNINPAGGEAGASQAAAFLENFTDYPWAHLDIAGVAWGDEQPYIRSGANGYGVPLLVELAKGWEK